MAIRIDDRREERIRIGTAAPPVRQKNEQDAAAQRKSACGGPSPSPSFSAFPASLSLAASGEQSQHLAGLSVSSCLRFLEDRSAVLEHFKPATLRRDELHIGVGILLPDLGRQTDGPRFVVSDRAVLYLDRHGSLMGTTES
jgi:hypothetical protein